MCLVDELVSRSYGAHRPGLVGSQYHAHPGLPGVPVISPVFPLCFPLRVCSASLLRPNHEKVRQVLGLVYGAPRVICECPPLVWWKSECRCRQSRREAGLPSCMSGTLGVLGILRPF